MDVVAQSIQLPVIAARIRDAVTALTSKLVSTAKHSTSKQRVLTDILERETRRRELLPVLFEL